MSSAPDARAPAVANPSLGQPTEVHHVGLDQDASQACLGVSWNMQWCPIETVITSTSTSEAPSARLRVDTTDDVVNERNTGTTKRYSRE